ncbi:MAG: hypothetical protein BWK79_04760 [Beggiatoa sp. IS2]|nr:MAG: hypothetical protein BWK79_04760 [Beggiatoa sp. IS2]
MPTAVTFKLILTLLCMSGLNGCSHIAYYSQAAAGQWDIFRRSQPIAKVVANPTTSSKLKQQLSDIVQIRAFASQELHLPDNRSYTYYADLERPYAVWSVVAAPAFSLIPKQWCFLFLGCISYRGYFSQESAQVLAAELRAQDYDVYVAGVVAYSTLGWFTDPVLNTVLAWPQPHIAAVIFHELAHQQLYIPNDTTFNESFAVAVEQVGVERWLAQQGTSEETIAYQESRRRETEFIGLVLATRNQLQAIYQRELPRAELQIAKEAAFDDLRNQYVQLRSRWGNYTGYDKWFREDLNNAKLASVVTYQALVPAFRALLTQKNGDLLAFYEEVAKLGKLPKEQRYLELEKLKEKL